MDAEYEHRGEPLQAALAKSLILEVLRERGGVLQRAEIAVAVVRVHNDRGGLPGKQHAGDMIKRALWYLEEDGLVERAGGNGRWRLREYAPGAYSELAREESLDESGPEDDGGIVREGPVLGEGYETVYLYFLPNDRELARLTGRDVWECKIGRTGARDSRDRILNPKTGFAHPPVIGIELRSDHSSALERELQGHLREIGAEVDDSPGSEWFYTSPERVRRWFEQRRYQLDCLRGSLTSSTS